jgi:hypothetical protein
MRPDETLRPTWRDLLAVAVIVIVAVCVIAYIAHGL